VTYHDLVTHARDRLIRAGIGPHLAGLDAEVLARKVLGWDRAQFLAGRHDSAPEEFAPRYERLIARRERREPTPYITGLREFWGLEFEVTPDVLIPRPETELILEEAIACLEGEEETGRNARIVDVGTGSGVLAIGLALHFPTATLVATDISHQALQVARRNAQYHGVAERIRFVETSFLTLVEGPITMVVSNPPYVPSISAPGLIPEVREHEPHIALFGGKDGLEGLRQVLLEAAPKLADGGWLIVEFGCGQDEAMEELVAAVPSLTLVRMRPDLQGIPRTAVMRKGR